MNKKEKDEILKQRFQEMSQYENTLRQQGFRYIVGIDEVGRGPLAGPVVAAAVALPEDFFLLGIDDSKKLTEKKREKLFDAIMSDALAVGIGLVNHKIIDEINILEATKVAMKEALNRAASALYEKTGTQVQHVLIDALTLKDVVIPQTGIIKGDANSISIAAASIVAKVTRDRMMEEYHQKHPHYAFDKNKGYGTKAHYEGLSQYGICEIHRRSFLKKAKVAQDENN